MLERVSYHAVIRYLERVLGLPVDAVRLSMLTEPVMRAMRSRSQKTKVITREAIYVVTQGSLVTVLTPTMQAYRKKKYKAHKSRRLEEV